MTESYPICLEHNIELEITKSSVYKYSYHGRNGFIYYCNQCNENAILDYEICPACMLPMYVYVKDSRITFCSNINCSLWRITCNPDLNLVWEKHLLYTGYKKGNEKFFRIMKDSYFIIHPEIFAYIRKVLINRGIRILK